MRLYIKGQCSICRGKPLGCPYCDSEGLTYVEASDNLILQFIDEADENLKQKIYEKLKDNQ